jgi:hypothetical protein
VLASLPVLTRSDFEKHVNFNFFILRARPAEIMQNTKKSSKSVDAIYEFFMLDIFFIWAQVRISPKFCPSQHLFSVTAHLHFQLNHKEIARNTSPFW